MIGFFSSPFIISTQSRIVSILTILLQIVVITFIIILNLTKIYLRHPGNLDSNLHIAYVSGITLLATIIASATTGQIRKIWVLRITNQWDVGDGTEKRRKKASTVVGLASLMDSLCWPISVSFLITSLITTAIVAATTPTIVTVVQSTLGLVYTKHTHDFMDQACLINKTSDWFSWNTTDGGILSINTTADAKCELQQVRSVAASISYDTSGEDVLPYRYFMKGVPVSRNAIGAPYSLEGGGFALSFGFTAQNLYVPDAEFLWISQCFHIVARNPVSCQTTGNVTVSGNNVTVNAADCSVTGRFLGVDPNTQGATVSGACTQGHDIGTATIVLGSVNEHAVSLVGAMNDVVSESTSSYAVACSVDIAPSVSLRQLNYSRVSSDEEFSQMFGSSFYVDGDNSSSCTVSEYQLSDFLTDTVLATGAAASWSLLMERQYYDGWWPILDSKVNGDYSFEDSQNPLEDVLGLASGIALGMYWGTDGYLEFTSDNPLICKGTTGINGVRIGSSKPWALVYILPSLFSVVLLSVLLIQTWKFRSKF